MEKHVLGLDPGKVTGWSRWEMAPERPLRRLEYGLIRDGVDGMTDWLMQHHRWVRESVLVVEGFTIESTKVEYRIPLRIEGAIIASCMFLGAPPPLFQPRTTKRAVADADLKAHGLWLHGSDPWIQWEDARDVNDSQIHVLAYAKHADHQPTVRQFWPDDLLEA